MTVFAQPDLRAFCRDMGVPVTFAGASTYADGQPVLGLLDLPSQTRLAGDGWGGVELGKPELRLPFNAFARMPDNTDVITVAGQNYTVLSTNSEDDGAFVCLELKLAE